MKKMLFAVVAAALVSGCSMKDSKLTLCVGMNQKGECPESFREVDGRLVTDFAPGVIGSAAGDVADTVLTCINYSSDKNLSCPEDSVMWVIDLIK